MRWRNGSARYYTTQSILRNRSRLGCHPEIDRDIPGRVSQWKTRTRLNPSPMRPHEIRLPISSARLVRDSAVPEFFGGSKSKDSAAEPMEPNDVMRCRKRQFRRRRKWATKPRTSMRPIGESGQLTLPRGLCLDLATPGYRRTTRGSGGGLVFVKSIQSRGATKLAFAEPGEDDRGDDEDVDERGSMPPKTGAASGCMTSTPGRGLEKIGSRPAMAVATVMTFGRRRAPALIAARSSSSSGRRRISS